MDYEKSKGCFKQKKEKGFFCKGDQEGLKNVQKELKRVIKEEKATYREKLNEIFQATT